MNRPYCGLRPRVIHNSVPALQRGGEFIDRRMTASLSTRVCKLRHPAMPRSGLSPSIRFGGAVMGFRSVFVNQLKTIPSKLPSPVKRSGHAIIDGVDARWRHWRFAQHVRAFRATPAAFYDSRRLAAMHWAWGERELVCRRRIPRGAGTTHGPHNGHGSRMREWAHDDCARRAGRAAGRPGSELGAGRVVGELRSLASTSRRWSSCILPSTISCGSM